MKLVSVDEEGSPFSLWQIVTAHCGIDQIGHNQAAYDIGYIGSDAAFC